MRPYLLAMAIFMSPGQEDKLPIPSQADQKKNEKLIRDLLKDGYQRRDQNSRRLLARTLCEAAGKEVKDWGLIYSFYKEAAEVAADAMDFDLAISAVEQLEKTFKVEPESPLTGATFSARHEIRKSLFKRTQKAAQSLDDCSAYVRGALKLAELYYLEDCFDDGLLSSQMAETVALASGDRGLLMLSRTAIRKYGGLKREHDKIIKAHLKALADPNDAEAAHVWGQFLAFVKDDWERAAPWIARGKEGPLKDVSRKEAEKAPAEELADGWLGVAEKAKDADRSRFRSRARYWLEKAVAGASGADRLKLEKKLDDTNKALGIVDLIRLVDPTKDFTSKGQAKGAFAKLDGARLLLSGAEFQMGFLEFPYAPPQEYTLTIIARHAGGAFAPFTVGLSDGAHQWSSTVGLYHASLGIQNVDGKPFEFDESTKGAASIKLGATGTFVFTVRNSGFTITVDGRDAFDWAGDPKRLSAPDAMAVSRKNTLFIASGCRYEIEKAIVVPSAGSGQRLR